MLGPKVLGHESCSYFLQLTCCFFSSTLTQMVYTYRDPDGEAVFTTKHDNTASNTGFGKSYIADKDATPPTPTQASPRSQTQSFPSRAQAYAVANLPQRSQSHSQHVSTATSQQTHVDLANRSETEVGLGDQHVIQLKDLAEGSFEGLLQSPHEEGEEEGSCDFVFLKDQQTLSQPQPECVGAGEEMAASGLLNGTTNLHSKPNEHSLNN